MCKRANLAVIIYFEARSFFQKNTLFELRPFIGGKVSLYGAYVARKAQMEGIS